MGTLGGTGLTWDDSERIHGNRNVVPATVRYFFLIFDVSSPKGDRITQALVKIAYYF